ncbi:MAG: hypothetical protein WC881_00155 [Elusimicrobiota bacterium]|jgi:hypothetical protein
MKTTIALFLLLAASPASAVYFDAGLGQSFGHGNYVGTSGFVEVGEDDGIYAKPSFSTYHSDYIKSTKTYGLRAGYANKHLDIGLEGSVTPKVDGYRSNSLGADATFSLFPGRGSRRSALKESSGKSSSGLLRVDLGGGIRQTSHKEDTAAAVRRGRGTGHEINLNQTDLSAFAGASIFIVDANAELTQSLYSKSSDQMTRSLQQTAGTGANPAVFGFPNTSATAKVSVRLMPLLRPFAQYTHTTYKLQQPASHAYRLGAKTDLMMVQAQGYYEIYDPGAGAKKQAYYGLSAGLKF